MTTPVIVAAARTAIGRSFKGTLAHTPPELLATAVLPEVIHRAGIDPATVDDVILAESHYGGGVLARYAAEAVGMETVAGQAVNRHCAGSLTAVANAAAQIRSGMEHVLVAGGVQSLSMSPQMTMHQHGPETTASERWLPPTHVETTQAPTRDMSITVGWNTAQAANISRQEMDAWAARSHHRAIEAIDRSHFDEEIVALEVIDPGGSVVEFAVDEHPRRDTSAEKLATLPVLHPEIAGFSITAGNSSGTNDAAAAVVLTDPQVAGDQDLTVLGRVRAWASAGITPRLNGLGAVSAIDKVLHRAGLTAEDITVWEVNEAFASVPIAVCREYGLDEDRVNVSGSGCSLGHPIAASGARMITTLIYELQRRGGGIAVAAMCAGGGMGGAVVIEA